MWVFRGVRFLVYLGGGVRMGVSRRGWDILYGEQ